MGAEPTPPASCVEGSPACSAYSGPGGTASEARGESGRPPGCLQKAVPEPRGLQVHLACGDRKPEALAAQQPRDRQRRVAQWDLLASVARGPRPRVEGPTDVLPYQQSAPPLPVGRVSKSFRWDSPGLRQQEAPLDGPGQEHEGGFPVQAAGTWGQGSRGGGRRRMGAPGGWHLCGHSGLMMWSG